MSEFHFVPVEITSPLVENLLNQFRELYSNGKVSLNGFQLEGDYSGTVFGDPHLPDRTMEALAEFLVHPDVELHCPALNVEQAAESPGTETTEEEPEYGFDWAETGPFAAEGILTHLMIFGGADVEFTGELNDARRLSAGLMDGLLEDRHVRAQAAVCDTAWSPWFYDIAWDFSLFILDQLEQKYYLLTLTDQPEE